MWIKMNEVIIAAYYCQNSIKFYTSSFKVNLIFVIVSYTMLESMLSGVKVFFLFLSIFFFLEQFFLLLFCQCLSIKSHMLILKFFNLLQLFFIFINHKMRIYFLQRNFFVIMRWLKFNFNICFYYTNLVCRLCFYYIDKEIPSLIVNVYCVTL